MTTQTTTTDRQTLSAPRPAAPCPTKSWLPACSKAVQPGKRRRVHLLPALVLMLVSSGRPALAAPSPGAPVLIGPMHLLLRNNPPIPTFSSFIMAEDTIYNGTLTATDQEGTPLSYAKAWEPDHGALSVNAGGGFTYTPTANYFGLDSFTYSVSDGGHTVSQVVSVTVTDVAEANQAPTWPALADVSRWDKQWFLPIDPIETSSGVNDLDGDTLTYSATGLPTGYEPAYTGLSVDPSTGIISGSYDALWPESFSITVTVSDWNGWELVRSFTLTFVDNG